MVGTTTRFFHTKNSKEDDDWKAFSTIIKEVDLPLKQIDNLKDNEIDLATPEQKRIILNELDQHIIDALNKQQKFESSDLIHIALTYL